MFQERDISVREDIFLEAIDGDSTEVERLRSLVGLTIELTIPQERDNALPFLNSTNTPHWLSILGEEQQSINPKTDSSLPLAIHFYGFKGGQGRSTVLAMLAKHLANDGFRVLAVDADLEAPSLDLMFDISASEMSGTLMGLCGWSDNFEPLPAVRSANSNGLVDIVPCRPREYIYDMDYSAFVVRTSIDINLLTRGMRALKSYLVSEGLSTYDVVLFDHRTGIASSVLPIVKEWQGPVVACARPDGISAQAMSIFSSLFLQNPENPGAFLSFSLDEQAQSGNGFGNQSAEAQKLLECLATAIAHGAEGLDVEPLPPDSLQNYWVRWVADKALFHSVCPSVNELRALNLDALSQLREVLGLTIPPSQFEALELPITDRSPSGAIDGGWFIETPEIAKLLVRQSPYTYIVGRKGTGKTRLHREMVLRNLAEPLFSSADYVAGGVTSQGVLFSGLLQACGNDYGRFWWALLSAALTVTSTAETIAFETELRGLIEMPYEELEKIATSYHVAKLVSSESQRRYFAIDGVETAVHSQALRPFVEQLLLFALTIQSDSRLSKAIQLRIFLRSDLLRNATQNIEQQISGKVLELQWGKDSIYNFVLARIERQAWFREKFPIPCETIRERMGEIRAGSLPQNIYERLILEIFPTKLRRNNLQTLTFLDTYFSDAGVGENGASFYPRLFDAFLNEVTLVAEAKESKGISAIENSRVAHGVVLDAHENASLHFLNEVKQELYNLIDFGTESNENKRHVDSLLAALDGKQTPFKLDEMVNSVAVQLDGISSNKIRDALKAMQEFGIFELRPGYPGEWRAGRLYKQALRMKYVR
jgi:hypothetical protein